MGNKITYGLKNVYIAFKGVAQAHTITVTKGCELDGELTVTLTAAALGDASPLELTVPVSTESHGTPSQVASAICNVINNNATASAAFRAVHLAGKITIIAKVVAENDPTMNIAVEPSTTEVTVGDASAVTAGATGWGTPQAIPGAVKFTPSIAGDETNFYADNGLYFNCVANNGYTADLEMANVSDAILSEMLGWLIDDNGAIVEITDATPKKFALMGQVEGDSKARRFVYYDCQASRPAKEHATKEESITPATDVLNLIISPVEIDERTLVRNELELSDDNTTAYNAFFESVYVPVVS